MSVVINTNFSATLAANNLAASSSFLQRSLNRLSSGSKIVSPADDAGGLAVSMKLYAAAKRQGAVSSNIGNATSYLQTQDGALKVVGNLLDRISELKTLYADPTKNASDKANYNSEFTALQSQLTALGSEKFNGVALFGTNAMTVAVTEDGSTSSAVTAAAVELLGGTTAAATITDNFANLSNWTNTGTNSASVTGGQLYLPGTQIVLTNNQTISGAYEINFDYRNETSGLGDFYIRLGGSTIVTSPNPNDTASHHLRITGDGAGNVAWYLDGAGAPTGTQSGTPTSGAIGFRQVGFGPGSYLTNFTATGTITSATSNVGSVAAAGSLGALNLSTVTSALQDVATYRAQNGAAQSRLSFANELLTTNKANLEAANSRIVDVDVAGESTQLARWNTLVQAGTSMLSQANQSAQTALKLLQ